MDALKRSHENCEQTGAFAVVADMAGAWAKSYYKKHILILLPDSKKRFMAMETLQKLFEDN